MAWWSPGSGSWRERWITAAVVTTVFDRWGRCAPLVCQCHDTSVECRTLDSTLGNFPRPCWLILPIFFFCNTLDTDMILIFYHSLVVKKSWHRLQGTKHIWRLPCGIVIPMSLQWTLVFIPSRGCLGLLGFFSRVCEPFGFPPEYRTRQDNPDVNTPKEVWSLCVHRLFLCKNKGEQKSLLHSWPAAEKKFHSTWFSWIGPNETLSFCVVTIMFVCSYVIVALKCDRFSPQSLHAVNHREGSGEVRLIVDFGKTAAHLGSFPLQMDGWMDGSLNEWMDGSLNEWMNG